MNAPQQTTREVAYVELNGRHYSVYYHYETGAPCTVVVHKKNCQPARLDINGPTARAAIAKATGAAQ